MEYTIRNCKLLGMLDSRDDVKVGVEVEQLQYKLALQLLTTTFTLSPESSKPSLPFLTCGSYRSVCFTNLDFLISFLTSSSLAYKPVHIYGRNKCSTIEYWSDGEVICGAPVLRAMLNGPSSFYSYTVSYTHLTLPTIYSV